VVCSLKLNLPQLVHFLGFGLGGLQPPQYGLQDQHICLPPHRFCGYAIYVCYNNTDVMVLLRRYLLIKKK
jgi:hypothetical protein